MFKGIAQDATSLICYIRVLRVDPRPSLALFVADADEPLDKLGAGSG